MNKALIVTMMALVTALAGVSYLAHNQSGLRGANQWVPNDSAVYESWLWWKSKYGKTYTAKESALKYKTYYDNFNKIMTFNQEKHSFTLAVNQFADMTNEEFRASNQASLMQRPAGSYKPVTLSTVGVPTSVDWRTKGAVTPVKNQGQCGSCWAFSTTGSLEGLNFITNGNLLSFSEQQLVDCSTSFGNQGCNGGLMDYAFKYVMANGITTESQYPYTGADGTCVYKASMSAFKNGGYSDVPANNPTQLLAAAAKQPISIAIEADQMSFQFYSGGVFSDASCGTSLDHGVLIAGYGVSSGTKYWIVKNSWAATWGLSGYIEIANQAGAGVCGINMQASYPTA